MTDIPGFPFGPGSARAIDPAAEARKLAEACKAVGLYGRWFPRARPRRLLALARLHGAAFLGSLRHSRTACRWATRCGSLSAMPASLTGISAGMITPVAGGCPRGIRLTSRERAARVNWNGPVRFLHPDGKVRRRPPIPWRTRARLRARRVVDGACAWLCGHGHEEAALETDLAGARHGAA